MKLEKCLTVVVAVAGALGAAGVTAPAALASCSQTSDTGIWVRSADSTMGHGVQGQVLVHSQNAGDCPAAGYVSGEGTMYMGVGGGTTGNWAEIGWQQIQNLGGPTWELFTEWGTNCQTSGEHLFTSGCAAVNTWTTFKVVLTDATNHLWAMQYACNGGGFTTHSTSNNLFYGYGWPEGEISHHSTNGPTYYDSYQSLIYKNRSDVWSTSWGSYACANDTAPISWDARSSSPSAYTTSTYSSGIC